MPLEILGPLVLSGIIFSVLFVRFFANTPERLITNETQARALFLRDFPSALPGSLVVISKDRRGALIALVSPENSLGLVSVLGSKHITRLISARDLQGWETGENQEVELRLNDFTFPSIHFHFSSDSELAKAGKLLQSLTRNQLDEANVKKEKAT